MSAGRIAILSSGGDAPGMNAAIRAATTVALQKGWEVLGVERGYKGLVAGSLRPLAAADVAELIREGGTMLGSARCLEFHQQATRDVARKVLADAGIESLLVIGGNGSLAGARALTEPAELGAQVLRAAVVPASIDNDVGLTGMAIGVDTAMNTIMECCDKISDTASAHDRTFLVEVMGRDCGYLAMTAGIASGADAVLFPEAARTEEQIIDGIVRTVSAARQRRGRPRRAIIIKSEGVSVPTDRLKAALDQRLSSLDGDGGTVETRVTVLGHVVRGGRPTAFDRLLASRLANVAVRALMRGETRKMAAWAMPSTLPPEAGARSPDDPHCWLVNFDAALAETARMLDGTSPLAQWRARVFEEIEDVLRL